MRCLPTRPRPWGQWKKKVTTSILYSHRTFERCRTCKRSVAIDLSSRHQKSFPRTLVTHSTWSSHSKRTSLCRGSRSRSTVPATIACTEMALGNMACKPHWCRTISRESQWCRSGRLEWKYSIRWEGSSPLAKFPPSPHFRRTCFGSRRTEWGPKVK